jgi:uncharacterized protein YqfA (UPF0365 family)
MAGLSKILPIIPWMRAQKRGCPVPLGALFTMSYFKNIDPDPLVDAYIKAREGRLDLTLRDIELHHLCSGDVKEWVKACVQAKKLDLQTTPDELAALQLAGEDLCGITNPAPRVPGLPSSGTEA